MSVVMRILLLLVAGCSLLFYSPPADADTVNRNSPPLETVSLQLRWFHQFQFAGYYAAVEKGFYAEEGLHVELKELDPKQGRYRPVLSGAAQYGVGDTTLLQYRLKGKKVVLLAQIFQHSPLVLLTARESGLVSPEMLAGKKVMYVDAPIMAMFDSVLGGTSQIRQVPYSYNYDDLFNGRVDAMTAYLTDQPFRLKQQGRKVNIIDPRNYGIDFYGDNLFTTETELHNHPQRVEKIVRATLKGWQYALQHPQEIIDLILKNYPTKLSREQLEYEAKMVAKMILPDLFPLGKAEPNRFRRIAEIYARLGMAPTKDVPADFFYRFHNHVQIKLTAEERAWLANCSDLKLMFSSDFEPALIVNPDGSRSGFLVEFIELLNQRLGTRIGIHVGPIAEYGQQLKQKKVAGILALPPEFAKKLGLLATRSYLSTYPTLYARKEQHISRLEDLSGKTVAYLKGSFFSRQLLAAHPEIRTLPVASATEAFGLVFDGQVDAMLGVNQQTYLISKAMLTGIEPVHVFYENQIPVVMGIRSDLPELVRIINKGLASFSEEEKTNLFSRWLKLPENMVRKLTLTSEEQRWLAEHPRIRIRISANYPPFEFFQDGHYQGMAYDYLQLIGKKLGITFEPVEGLSWVEVLDKIGRGQDVDMILMITHTKEREKFLNFTRNFISFPEVVYTRLESPLLIRIEDLAGKVVAMEKGYIETEELKRKVPEIRLLETETSEEALEMVATGKADAHLGDLAVGSYLIDKRGFVNLKVAAPIKDLEETYAMAVRKDWPRLARILDKALATITADEHRQIRQKWLSIRYEHGIDWLLIWKWGGGIGGLLFLLLVVSAYWNRRLTKEVAVRRRTEAELEKAKVAAEAANRAKSIFLANMSHELRTPLTAILGYSYLLQRSHELPESLRSKVLTINRSGRHLSELINDVLEVSRIEAGRLEVKEEVFNLHQFLLDLEEMFALRAEENNLHLEFRKAGNLPVELIGDEGKLRQILINLLGNAFKFTDSGSITVCVEIAGMETTQLLISVTDTGVGIDPQELNVLFRPFEQTRVGKERGGTGLGLMISREFARLMGGDLVVSSEPGRGSTFDLSCRVNFLRNENGAEVPAARFIFGLSLMREQKKILIADDFKDTRNLLAQLLTGPGIIILEAGNGEEALELIGTEQPDLVIMDMRMPVLNGYEAIRRLKGELHSSIPVIAISASALESDRKEIIATGADAFLPKPVDVQELFRMTSRLLDVDCFWRKDDLQPPGDKTA